MKFYDLNIRGTDYDNDLALIKEAYRFGWDYLNLNYSQDNIRNAVSYKEDLLEEISRFDKENAYRSKYNDDSIGISMGINIQNANSNEIRKILNRHRKNSPYISALGGDLKVNRSVCENHRMDVLSRPYYRRRDSGMNHVLAKEAARNNVAIELCFRDVLKNFLKYRANLIASFKEILMFHRKYGFPLILTTDSKSVYDIRMTRDVASFFRSIGFTDEEIYNGFYYYPRKIIEFNRERKNMVVQGVKVVEGATDFTEASWNVPKYGEDDELALDDEIVYDNGSDFYDEMDGNNGSDDEYCDEMIADRCSDEEFSNEFEDDCNEIEEESQ